MKRRITFFLAAFLLLFSYAGLAQVVSGTTYSTPSVENLPTGWSGNDGDGTSYIKLIDADHYIQTANFEQEGFVSITLKARKFGGPSATQAQISVSWYDAEDEETVLGTIDPTNTTLTNYTINSPAIPESGNGYVKIQCKGASANKGAGISEVTITYTEPGGVQPTTYTVTYNANATGISPVVDTYAEGANVTLRPANTFTYNGHLFSEWNTQADGDGDSYEPGDVIENIQDNIELYAIWTEIPADEQWVLTNLADLTANDVFVIVGTRTDANYGGNYAMSNDKGTGSAPSAVAVTLANNEITSTVAANIQWTISGNATDGYTFYPNGSTTTWLYCYNNNNGLRVGTGADKTFVINSNYLYNSGQSRYIGVYQAQDWRSYTSINTNIQNQTFAFYKKVTGGVVPPSITAANVDIEYNATSGSITYTINNEVEGGTLTAATESDWLTLSQGTASPIAFTCTANPAGTARTATVTLTYTYNRAAVTHDVTVTQTAAPVAYTTIPALFEAATSTETSVQVTFNNWVVSGVSTNGKNVFVTDNEGHGFVIFNNNGGLDQTYAVGNILSGTAVSCTLKKYNGFAELLNVNAADLTIGAGGTVTTANIALADLAGVNTGALLHYDNLTCNVTTNLAGTTSYYYLTDGTTSIQVYSALYAFGSLEHGKKYNITGIYQQYNDTKEILPRSVADIEEVVSAEPSVTISPATIDAPAEGASGTLTVTYENINESEDDEVVFCDAAGAETNYDWITAELNSEHNVEYTVFANEGAARTAYFKVLAFDENLDDFFSNIVTVTQAEYVAPSYATLPFTFTGGKAAIENTDGLTQEGLGNDYSGGANATTPLKFDSTDDWLLLQFNERPGTLNFDITGNSFSGSTFTVQTSEDGTTYTDLQAYTELGATQHEEFTNLGENVRYIKWIYTNKASGNVGLGTINLYKYGEGPVAEPSVTVTPATIDAPAEGSTGTLAIAYENIPDLISFDYYFCNANGDELEDTDPNYPDWIDAAIEEENEVYSVAYSIHANEGAARTAYFKVYTTDTPNQEEVYAIVTVTQAEYVAPVLDYAELPFAFDGGRADIASTDGLTQDGLESDYADSPKLKFKNTGTWVILHFNERPGTLTFDIKGNSFSGGTFTVQTSEDGVTYTDLKNYTDTNFDNTLHSEEFTNLGENVRYIKWIYTNKASGNVGLGAINLYKYGEGPVAEPSVTVTPATISAPAEGDGGTLDLTYENLTITEMGDFDIQYYDAEGGETTEPDWMEVLVAEQDPEIGEGYVVSYWVRENESDEARTAYFKVYALDDEDELVYSNLVTVNQAAPETPVTPSNYVRITSLDQLTEGCKVIIAARYDEGDATAYAAMTNATSGKPVGENFTSITSDGNEVLPSTITNNETEYYWTVNLTENGYTFTNTVGLMIGYSGSDTDFQSGGDHVEWTIERSTSEAGLMPNYTGFVITNHYSTNRAFAYNGAKFGAYAKSNMSGNYNFYLDFFVETLPANSIAIEGYANCENPYGGYYLIASPFTVAPASVPGMTQGNYDLYYFTDDEEAEWINYKNEDGTINEDFGPLTPGKGYLYAHETDVILTFDGEPYEGNGEVTLSLNANNTGSWKGWNLVGNPYTETAYIDRDFYVMNSEGSEFIEGSAEDGIAPMQGIFVIANYDEEPMTFSTTQTSEPTNGKIVMNVRKDRNMVVDRAMIRFGEGHQLPKLMLNPDNTKLYIDQNGEDFAVVRSIDENSTPVSFRAAENGTYTLSINAEEIEMEYLHLIDNMTGADIDLLATPSYTFEARTTDYTSRFNLVYATLTDVNENNVQPFAFYNGSEWVINNEGNATLQVIDVTGRVLSSETVNGNTRISLEQVPGVYVMRLVNGDNVKTQKVVVR